MSDPQTAPDDASRLDVMPPPGEAEPRGPAISPSRAGDFMTCPLLYRFRVIDRLPEPPSPAAARGTLVHAVLERLFDRPAAERTPQLARSLAGPEWDRLVAESPELAALFTGEPGREAWTAEVTAMLDRYFIMEDPRRIEPAERELYVETTLESGLRLRGYVDRLDVASGGAVRIVDYKTGTAPREEFEARALFQMKFYALVLWRTRGAVPRLLQLMYLGNGEILRYQPDEADLRATERKILALWRAIERARESGDWRPRPSRVCDWCAHKAICPAFGGTPPPLPEARPADADPAVAATDDAVPAVPATDDAAPAVPATDDAAPAVPATDDAAPAVAATDDAAPAVAATDDAGPAVAATDDADPARPAAGGTPAAGGMSAAGGMPVAEPLRAAPSPASPRALVGGWGFTVQHPTAHQQSAEGDC